MAYDHQSARFADISLALKAQLVRVFALDPSCVRIVASDKYSVYTPTSGDFSLVCRVYGVEPDTDGGAGRRARQVKRLVRVYLYYRSNLDQAGDDETALTAENGFHDIEDKLSSCLDDYWPLSAAQTPLTIEPLHPLNSAEGPPVRKEEDDIGYLTGHSDWEVKYITRNSTPAP